MGALRSVACAVWLLAGLPACGRIGYEGVTVEERDGPIIVAPDAGSEVSEPVDQQASGPDRGPDVVQADAAPDATGEVTPDAGASDFPDASTAADAAGAGDSPDALEAPPRDAGVEGPTGRTVVAISASLTARRGGTGGGPGVADICADGRLLIGLEGTHAANPTFPWIQSVAGVCGALGFPAAPGAPAMLLESVRLPSRGGTSGQPWTRICPAGQVVVGFDGNAGSWIGQLVLACAPLARSASGAVVLGSVSELDDIGARADNDFPQTDCSPGQAARGVETRTGTWLDSFALICGSLAVR